MTITGWKSIRRKMWGWSRHREYAHYIVELEILGKQHAPRDYYAKCRTDKARVVRITRISDVFPDRPTPRKSIAHTPYHLYSDKPFTYTKGAVVTADLDESRCDCGAGINYFLTREEAVEWTRR